MRLAIVTRRAGGGDGQGGVNVQIAAAAARAGWQVTLFAAEADGLPGGVIWQKIDETQLPGRLIKDRVFARGSWQALKRAQPAFDIVHTNGFSTWFPADVNTVHFVHGGWYNSGVYPKAYGPKSLYRLLYTRENIELERLAFRQARHIVAVSRRIAAELINCGVSARNISVIHNGVDLAAFGPGACERARFGLPQDRPVALFAGDLKGTRKGLDVLLQALTSVAGIHVAIAGDVRGSAGPALARRLGLTDRVHFLGSAGDMAAFYRAGDFLVMPSRYEPFGLVALEAMASGLPVITFANAGAAEVIPASAGIVLPGTPDASGLAAALGEMCAALDRGGFGADAIRAVAARHGWSEVTACYLRLYTALLAEKRAASVLGPGERFAATHFQSVGAGAEGDAS